MSAATHHVVQLPLVKSQLAPSCSVRESSTSVIVHIVARHGRAIQFGFGSPLGLTLRDNSGNEKGDSGLCSRSFPCTLLASGPWDAAQILSEVRVHSRTEMFSVPRSWDNAIAGRTSLTHSVSPKERAHPRGELPQPQVSADQT